MLLLLGLLALFHPNAFPPGLCANPHQAPPPFSSRPTNGLKFAKQTSCFLQDAPLDGPRIQTELLTHYKCKCAASSGAAGWKTGCLSLGREGSGLGVGHASGKGPGADADADADTYSTSSQPFVLLLFQTSWSPSQPFRPSSHIGPTSAGPAPDQRLLSRL